MNVNLDFISLLNWERYVPTPIANFSHHIVNQLRRVSPYLQYNPMTEAGSVLAIHLALIHLSDRLMNVVSRYFQLSESSRWIETGRWVVKSVILLGGINAFNQLMNMQLSQIYLISSAVTAIALQILWQQVNYTAETELAKEDYSFPSPQMQRKEIEEIEEFYPSEIEREVNEEPEEIFSPGASPQMERKENEELEDIYSFLIEEEEVETLKRAPSPIKNPRKLQHDESEKAKEISIFISDSTGEILEEEELNLSTKDSPRKEIYRDVLAALEISEVEVSPSPLFPRKDVEDATSPKMPSLAASAESIGGSPRFSLLDSAILADRLGDMKNDRL